MPYGSTGYPYPAATRQPAPRAVAPRQQNNALATAPVAAPKIRMQMDEPERLLASSTRSKMVMPSPEELGLASRSRSAAAPMDWTAIRQRLDALGISGFQLQRLPNGSFRFSCELPTGQGAMPIRGEAPTEEGAVQQVLNQASARASR